MTRKTIGLLVIGVVGMLAGGCVAAGPYATMHPTAGPPTNAAGVSAGILYGTDDESGGGSYLSAPYGEGWARLAAGPGQLELRISPGIGFLSYRVDVVPQQEPGGFAFGLVPSMGLGLVNWSSGDGDTSEESGFLTLAPNLAALFWIGDLYLAPRFGYTHVVPTVGDQDSTGLVAVGGNIGYAVRSQSMGVSVETGFQRITSTEDGVDGATYVFVGSVGLHR